MVKSTSGKIFYLLLLVSLGIAGLLLLFTGWWVPDSSAPVQLTGIVWLLLCAATYFVRKQPYLQLATAWLWFACSTWSWWTATNERSIAWFLYRNILSILILVFSHLVVINLAKSSRSRT